MTRVLLVVVLALAAVSLGAQNQPTFRTGANYVRVDMYATRDGKPIEDLTVDEIDILEDGVLQKIDAFEHVKVRTAIPQESRIEPRGIAESREMASNPRARVFVIFLDTYHTQIEGSATMRKPLINFIDRVLGPDDMVALMTPEMAASDITLGRKTTVIANLLEREWFWGRRARVLDNDEKEDLYEACYPDMVAATKGIAKEMKDRRRQKLTLDALEDLIVHLGGIREERKAVLAVSEGWLRFTSSSQLARTLDPSTGLGAGVSPGDVLLRPPRPQPSDTGKLQGSPRVECEADRMALAMLNHDLRLLEITQDANRSNVTFYPVYARGLVAFDAPIGPDYPPPLDVDRANLAARQESLRFLADGTDGTSVINTNNIDGALRRIVEDLSSVLPDGVLHDEHEAGWAISLDQRPREAQRRQCPRPEGLSRVHECRALARRRGIGHSGFGERGHRRDRACRELQRARAVQDSRRGMVPSRSRRNGGLLGCRRARSADEEASRVEWQRASRRGGHRRRRLSGVFAPARHQTGRRRIHRGVPRREWCGGWRLHRSHSAAFAG